MKAALFSDSWGLGVHFPGGIELTLTFLCSNILSITLSL